MIFTPDISIVMPCYQQAEYLEEAVRSVLDQCGVQAELIVMDPGSTDGSRELLQSLKDEYKERLVLNFAPDGGQAEAINRGMSLARGNVLCWLNSDDRLRPDALYLAVTHLTSLEPQWLYGRGGIINELGEAVSTPIVWYKNWRGRKFSIHKLITEDFIPQMATYWNRALWHKVGGLDVNRHLDMDYDLFLKFAFITSPIVISDYLGDFRVHRSSKSSQRAGEHLAAAMKTAKEYSLRLGPSGRLAYLLHCILSIRTSLVYRITKP